MPDEGTSRIESSQIIPMFPTIVWKTQLGAEICESVNRAVVLKLGEWMRSLPPLGQGESWQSENQLQGVDAFGELLSHVVQAARSTLELLKVGDRDIAVTGCWVNVHAPGAGHRAHSHPNNFLSGAYYVETHEGADTIYFHDPRPQTGIIRPPVRELTTENTDQWYGCGTAHCSSSQPGSSTPSLPMPATIGG